MQVCIKKGTSSESNKILAMRGLGPSTAKGPRLIRPTKRAYAPLADVPVSLPEQGDDRVGASAPAAPATQQPTRVRSGTVANDATLYVGKCTALACSVWQGAKRHVGPSSDVKKLVMRVKPSFKWPQMDTLAHRLDRGIAERLCRCAAVLVAMDVLWLRLMSGRYEQAVLLIQEGAPVHVRWMPFVCAYCAMIATLWHAVLTTTGWHQPKCGKVVVWATIKRSATLGCLVWTVCNMSNSAAFSKWSMTLSLIDMMRATIMYGLAGLTSTF